MPRKSPAKTRTVAVGLGRLDYPDGRLSRLDARRTFLLTIQQEHVDVLETLRAALVDGPNVDAWARRWGLTDEWILDVARRGVRSGPFTDVLRKWKFGMASASLPDLIDDEDRVAIEDLAQPAAADPVTENRVAYVARAKRHWRASERLLLDRGLVPTMPKNPAHVQHLVRFQLGLVDALGTGQATLRTLAELIGLTLRRRRRNCARWPTGSSSRTSRKW